MEKERIHPMYLQNENLHSKMLITTHCQLLHFNVVILICSHLNYAFARRHSWK